MADDALQQGSSVQPQNLSPTPSPGAPCTASHV